MIEMKEDLPCDICERIVGVTHFDNEDGTVTCTPCFMKYETDEGVKEAITMFHNFVLTQYYKYEGEELK